MRSSFRALQLVCGFVSLGPIAVIAFTACGNSQPTRAPMEPSAEDSGGATATPTVTASASASASEAAVASTPPLRNDAGAAPPADLPPRKLVDVEPPCARGAGAFIDSHRSCTEDGECTIVSPCTPIGPCALGLRKDATAGFTEKHDAAVKACRAAKLPTGCPSCAQHPAPRCGAGFCRP